jgi:crossover junction endodeoxyribonuclease RusA
MNQADIALDPSAGTLQPVVIDLPWPHKDLSPNARVHHMRHYKVKKQFLKDCFLLTLASKVEIGPGRHRLDLVFYPSNKRRRDRDNLLASMKAGIDGLAAALGVDDSVFDPISVSVSPLMHWAGVGQVRVSITPYQE